MAIAKKPASKKTVTKVKSPLKKTAKTAKASQDVPMKSFRLSRNDRPFMTTRITKQTVYWSILLIFILLMQLWILNIQLDVIQITDSIANPAQSGPVSLTAHPKK